MKEDACCTTTLALGLDFTFNEEFTSLHSGLVGVAKFRPELAMAMHSSLTHLYCLQLPCDGASLRKDSWDGNQ